MWVGVSAPLRRDVQHDAVLFLTTMSNQKLDIHRVSVLTRVDSLDM